MDRYAAPMSYRDELRKLIADLAVVRGRVVLSSGREADSYVDLRRVTLHHANSSAVTCPGDRIA